MADISSQKAQQPHSTCYGPDFARAELETQALIISHQQLEEICHLLDEEFKRGLHRDTNAEANIKMYPTHLIDHKSADEKALEAAAAHSEGELSGAPAAKLPPGRLDEIHFAEPEEGKFLALDLGGTNFRVILLELEGAQFHMDNEVYSLSQELMHGPGVALFDYIADCLSNFVNRRNLNGHRLPLGFTFSFPVQQDKLAHARLVNWTKGFKCPDVEGRDVVGLLREAIERRPDLDIEVMAVVNDTTGTLISCAFKNRECRIGLIVGTGTNACYMEEVDNVHAMHPPTTGAASNSEGESSALSADDEADPEAWHAQHRRKQTVVNTEWGAFGDNGILDFVRTKWDESLDLVSLNRGRQKFEKMIGGLYVGELCRHVLRDLSLAGKMLFCAHLFEQPASCSLSDARKREQREQLLQTGPFSRQFSFQTRFVSMVESDAVDRFENTRRALEEAFGIDWASDADCAIVKLVCTRVSTRAAHLVSAAVACLLNRMARPFTVVGVDGSMFKFHPHFHSIMAKKTKELTRPKHRFQLMFSEDGSGKGAAIVASVACKQRRISAAL